MPLAAVKEDLNSTSTILIDFVEWYTFFFGEQGLVTIEMQGSQ